MWKYINFGSRLKAKLLKVFFIDLFISENKIRGSAAVTDQHMYDQQYQINQEPKPMAIEGTGFFFEKS